MKLKLLCIGISRIEVEKKMCLWRREVSLGGRKTSLYIQPPGSILAITQLSENPAPKPAFQVS